VDDILGGEEAWENKDQTEHRWYDDCVSFSFKEEHRHTE
jgi:hypothetical protein